MAMKRTRASKNVFADLGFSAEEAATLKMRADLLADLVEFLASKKLSRVKDVSERLQITPARASALLHQKFEDFRLDMLVTLAVRAGLRVNLKVAA